jgi:hypothetical protein
MNNEPNNEMIEMVKQADNSLEKIAKGIYQEALQYGMEKTGYGNSLRTGVRKLVENKFPNLVLNPTKISEFGIKHSPEILTGVGVAGATGLGLAIHSLAKKERLLRSAAKYVKAHKNALLIGALGAGGVGAAGSAYALTKQSSLQDPEYIELEKFALQRFYPENEKTAGILSNLSSKTENLLSTIPRKIRQFTESKILKGKLTNLTQGENQTRQRIHSELENKLIQHSPEIAAGIVGIGGGTLLARKLMRKKDLLNRAADWVKKNRTAALIGGGAGAVGLAGAGALASR